MEKNQAEIIVVRGGPLAPDEVALVQRVLAEVNRCLPMAGQHAAQLVAKSAEGRALQQLADAPMAPRTRARKAKR